MGILMALLMRKTLFSGEAVPFVMELPNYRMPGAKNVGHLLWDKAKDFLQRAFTVIFVATLVIWFLQTFNTHLSIVTDSKDSILAMVASVIAPIFRPMGYGDWRISTALITGFMAKRAWYQHFLSCLEIQRLCLEVLHHFQQQVFWRFVCCIHLVWQRSLQSNVNLVANGQFVLCLPSA